MYGARAGGFLARLNAIALGGDLPHSGNAARRKCRVMEHRVVETLCGEVLGGGDAAW